MGMDLRAFRTRTEPVPHEVFAFERDGRSFIASVRRLRGDVAAATPLVTAVLATVH